MGIIRTNNLDFPEESNLLVDDIEGKIIKKVEEPNENGKNVLVYSLGYDEWKSINYKTNN